MKGRLPRVKQSVLDYFMFSVLNTSERKQLIRFAFKKFEPKEEFVWCPERIQRRFLEESKTRKATLYAVKVNIISYKEAVPLANSRVSLASLFACVINCRR